MRRSMRLPTPSLAAVTALLVLAVLATAALSPILGVPVKGNLFAFDSDFAIVSLRAFANEIAAGEPWPRWLHDGNFGLGSATFYFYPPLAYWVAAAILIPTGLPAPAALTTAVAFWRVLSLLTCYAWLRGTHGRGVALAGAALAALFPYASVFNPWFRFGYAEVAAAALVPLLLLAIDRAAAARGATDPRGVAGIAFAYAALALTHLPATLLAAVFGVVYAAGRGGFGLALRCCAGGALGALLAGAFLVPAFALLPDANPGGLYEFIAWPRPLFLDLPWGEWRHLATLYAAWLGAAAATAWLLRGRWRALPWRERGPARGALVLLLGTMLATTPLAMPIWMPGTPLASVQFPWRVLVLTGPAFGAVAALALSAAVPPRRALLAGFAFLTPFGLLWANIHFGNPNWPRLLPSDQHEAWALAHSSSYPDEHWPAPAVAAGWLDPARGPKAGLGWPPPSVHELPAEPLWRHRPPALPEGARRIPGGFLLPEAGPAPFQLPQLWFPGWTASSASGPVATRASPETGFVEVHPTGLVRELRVIVTPTLAEWIGWEASAAGVVILVTLLLLGRRAAGVAVPQPGWHPPGASDDRRPAQPRPAALRLLRPASARGGAGGDAGRGAGRDLRPPRL